MVSESKINELSKSAGLQLANINRGVIKLPELKQVLASVAQLALPAKNQKKQTRAALQDSLAK